VPHFVCFNLIEQKFRVMVNVCLEERFSSCGTLKEEMRKLHQPHRVPKNLFKELTNQETFCPIETRGYSEFFPSRILTAFYLSALSWIKDEFICLIWQLEKMSLIHSKFLFLGCCSKKMKSLNNNFTLNVKFFPLNKIILIIAYSLNSNVGCLILDKKKPHYLMLNNHNFNDFRSFKKFFVEIRDLSLIFNPNPCTDLDKILYAHPHLSKEGFGAVLSPAHSSPWASVPETL